MAFRSFPLSFPLTRVDAISSAIAGIFEIEDDFFLSRKSAVFWAPLTNSLLPLYAGGAVGGSGGAGGAAGVPTFTRASAAYQTDFEGKYNFVPSGATRQQGARYVRNLTLASENFSSSYTDEASTVTTGTTPPTGFGTASYIIPIAPNTVHGRYQGFTVTAGPKIFSVWAKDDPASTYHKLEIQAANVAYGGGTLKIIFNLTTGAFVLNSGFTTYDIGPVGSQGYRRYDAVVTAVAGFGVHGLRIVNDADQDSFSGDATTGIYVAGFMVQDVTGQTNQNPAEYVSVGVLSTPYHGAGVDGVKYFDTLNGNTVASNVVTEATGAAINSSQAAAAGGVTAGVVDATGPKGLITEVTNTNSILQSNTLGTTWTMSNAADMNAVAADAYVSVDGTTTMDKLQPKATTAVHSLDQAFTFTAAQYTTSADLRYVAATPQRWVALILNDGTTTWGASFDLLNGVAGAVSAGATSSIEATALTGVYRVAVTNTANAAAAAGTVKISLNATDTATLESAIRAGTETLGAGMVQHEVGTIKSSRIMTTTVAVTRPADVEQYVSAGNLSATAMTIAMEITPSTALGSATVFHFGTYVDASNYTAILSDGTSLIARKRIAGANTDATVAFTRTIGTAVKAVARFDTVNGIDVWLGGTKGTGSATLTASQIGTNFQIGGDGNGASQDYCEHRNFRVDGSSLPDAYCKALST